MFSDLNDIFSLDKEIPMSHRYFIRKIKTWACFTDKVSRFLGKKLPGSCWISKRKPVKKFRIN